MGLSSDGYRRKLADLRDGLLRLHKTLLDSEREAYEHDVARIASSQQFLGLLLQDPWFAWLRELSGMIVAIDEALAAKEPATGEDAARLTAAVRALLMPDETAAGFGRRYFEAMQRDPGVIVAHGATVKLLSNPE